MPRFREAESPVCPSCLEHPATRGGERCHPRPAARGAVLLSPESTGALLGSLQTVFRAPGLLLFSISVATWELKSGWVGWLVDGFERNRNATFFWGWQRTRCRGLRRAGQSEGASWQPREGCTQQALGAWSTFSCPAAPPTRVFSPQSSSPRRRQKRLPHGWGWRRGAGGDPASAGRRCPGPARRPGLPGCPVRCLQTVRAARGPSAFPPGAGDPSVTFGGCM